MEELQDFQPSQLMKLLATETITYYKLIGYGASKEECTQCNDRIKKIEMELESRKNSAERDLFYRPVTAGYSL